MKDVEAVGPLFQLISYGWTIEFSTSWNSIGHADGTTKFRGTMETDLCWRPCAVTIVSCYLNQTQREEERKNLIKTKHANNNINKENWPMPMFPS